MEVYCICINSLLSPHTLIVALRGMPLLQSFIFIVLLVSCTEGLPQCPQAGWTRSWMSLIWIYIVHFPTKPIWASNFITFQPFNFVLFEILMGSPKALSYVEFFAGEANVFSQVKKMYGATAIDIEYYKSPVGPHSNPFDILTASGLASLNLIRNIYSLFFGWWKYFWKSTQVSMDQNHICVCGLKRKVYFQFHMTWGWQYIWCCLAVNRPSVDYSGQSAVPGLRSTVAPRGEAFCCQRAWKRWIM